MAERFVRAYGASETVFEQGSRGEKMYVVQAGTVEIRKRQPDGDEVLAELAKGEIFGALALVEDLPRASAAVAGPAGADVVEIDSPQFVYLVGEQPVFALVVLKAMSRLLRAGIEV